MTESNLTFTETGAQLLIVGSFACRSGPTVKAQSLVHRMLSLLPGTVSTCTENQHENQVGQSCQQCLPAALPQHQGHTTAFPEPCWATQPPPGAKGGSRKRTVGFLQCLQGIWSFRGRGSKIGKGEREHKKKPASVKRKASSC